MSSPRKREVSTWLGDSQDEAARLTPTTGVSGRHGAAYGRLLGRCHWVVGISDLRRPTVDVVVMPASGRKGLWQLEDRLRRKLGEITEVRPHHFVIHPNPDGSLSQVSVGPYATLDDAMDGITRATHAECQLASKA